eukprot:364733-Chlamydomonas_euryale.AAC.4
MAATARAGDKRAQMYEKGGPGNRGWAASVLRGKRLTSLEGMCEPRDPYFVQLVRGHVSRAQTGGGPPGSTAATQRNAPHRPHLYCAAPGSPYPRKMSCSHGGMMSSSFIRSRMLSSTA